MKKFLFVFTTIIVGTIIQLGCNLVLTFWGAGPQLLLLAAIAVGFIRGSMMGQTVGFFWGFIIDAVGVSLFGLQSLLLTLIGYLSGKLRRRVDSERPAAQMVIGFVGTIFYGIGAIVFQNIFEKGIERGFIQFILISSVLNVLLVPAVFWLMERWILMWGLGRE